MSSTQRYKSFHITPITRSQTVVSKTSQGKAEATKVDILNRYSHKMFCYNAYARP